MDEPRGYALSPDFAERLEDVVNIVETGYRNPSQPKRRRPVHQSRNVQFVRVTSSAGFTISGIKYLEAIVQTWSVADGGFEDLTDDPSCYLFQISNADLTTDGSAVYEAVQMAAYDFGDGILPVFGTQWQPLVLDVICNASDNIEITTTV